MRAIIRLRDFLVYTNIYIGLCAAALSWETFALLKIPSTHNWYLLLIFGATLFVYNLHYFAKLKGPKENSRMQWCRGNKMLLLAFVIGSLLFILAVLFYHYKAIFGGPGNWQYRNLIVLLIIPALALAYSFPIFKKSLRQIGWLKMISLSGIWAFSTVLLPVFLLPDGSGIAPDDHIVLMIFINRFIFIAALSVVFNLKDLEEDKQAGIRTLAVIFGQKKVLQWGQRIFPFLFLGSACIFIFSIPDSPKGLGGGIGAITVAIFRCFRDFRSEKYSEPRFVMEYDGLMLVQPLILIFVQLFTH